jgi:hypothetical protein
MEEKGKKRKEKAYMLDKNKVYNLQNDKEDGKEKRNYLTQDYK